MHYQPITRKYHNPIHVHVNGHVTAMMLTTTTSLTQLNVTLNAVQHTVYVASQVKDSPTCRFNYPQDVCNISDIQFQELSNGTVRATLNTKWNDPWLNSHQRVMPQNWRANVDLQVIIDVKACARYMAKYATKA